MAESRRRGRSNLETSRTGDAPYEVGELGSMDPKSLSSCVEQGLNDLEELIYWAQVEISGATDDGKASKLGLVNLWKRTYQRFPFRGSGGHCGQNLIELALRKLGETIAIRSAPLPRPPGSTSARRSGR